jgi:hypothetical protein
MKSGLGFCHSAGSSLERFSQPLITYTKYQMDVLSPFLRLEVLHQLSKPLSSL